MSGISSDSLMRALLLKSILEIVNGMPLLHTYSDVTITEVLFANKKLYQRFGQFFARLAP